jgi:hypothetical protein
LSHNLIEHIERERRNDDPSYQGGGPRMEAAPARPSDPGLSAKFDLESDWHHGGIVPDGAAARRPIFGSAEHTSDAPNATTGSARVRARRYNVDVRTAVLETLSCTGNVAGREKR